MGRSNSCIAVVVIKLLNNLCEYPSNICIRCIRIDFPPSEQIKSANADADLEELRTDTDQILADTGRILQMASSARIWIICLSHCEFVSPSRVQRRHVLELWRYLYRYAVPFSRVRRIRRVIRRIRRMWRIGDIPYTLQPCG